MKGFIIETTSNDKFMIIFDGHEDIITNDYCFTSSYNVLAARVLGFSYPDYLLYCQSKGAKLKGRTGYTFPYWENKKECQEVCNTIEKEWQKVLREIKFR